MDRETSLGILAYIFTRTSQEIVTTLSEFGSTPNTDLGLIVVHTLSKVTLRQAAVEETEDIWTSLDSALDNIL